MHENITTMEHVHPTSSLCNININPQICIAAYSTCVYEQIYLQMSLGKLKDHCLLLVIMLQIWAANMEGGAATDSSSAKRE